MSGLKDSLELVETWADDEHTRVGAVTVLTRHKALMALARRLGRRTLAEATVGDVEAWLATVAPRTKETYAIAVRSFYRWAVAEQIVSPAVDPSRAVRRRVVAVFEPNAELVAAWRVGMERRGLAAATIEMRRNQLRLLQTWIGPDRSPLDVTADELEKWLDSRIMSSNARRDAISHVHALFTWAVKMRMVECDPTLAIDRPKVVVHMARPMPDDDLRLALERATGEIRCWLLLGAYAGLRCQEIAGIDRRDVMEHETPPLLLVRKGKGRKERIVPLHPEIIEALRWRGLPQSGPLFTAGPGQRHRPISPCSLSQRGNKWLHDQGIAGTMHQLRHWFGTHTYRASRDLRIDPGAARPQLAEHDHDLRSLEPRRRRPHRAGPFGRSAVMTLAATSMSNAPTPSGASSSADSGQALSLSLLERWAEAEAARVGPGTVRRRRKALTTLAWRLGERPLSQATEADVEAWFSRVSPTTARGYAGAVVSFSRWAVAEGVLDDHLRPPRRLMEQPPTSTGTAATKYLAEKRAVGTICRTTELQHRRILYAFTELCPPDPAKIGRRDIVRWMKSKGDLSATSRRLHHTTARGFTDWLLRRGVIRRDPFAEILAPRVPRAVHRALDSAQVAALVAACETRREHVLLLLALHTGMRRAELAALEVGDVNLAGRTLLVRRGKGGDARLLPLSAEAAQVVGQYLSAEGLSAGPLLRSETQPERGVSPQTVWRVFNVVAKRSGVKVRAGDGVATHATRHTCATDTHRATGDVLVVQALLGHSSLQTTERYIQGLSIEHLREAVEGRSYLTPQ